MSFYDYCLFSKYLRFFDKIFFGQDGVMEVSYIHSNNIIFTNKYTTNTVPFSMALEKAAESLHL